MIHGVWTAVCCGSSDSSDSDVDTMCAVPMFHIAAVASKSVLLYIRLVSHLTGLAFLIADSIPSVNLDEVSRIAVDRYSTGLSSEDDNYFR